MILLNTGKSLKKRYFSKTLLYGVFHYDHSHSQSVILFVSHFQFPNELLI